MLCCAHVAQAQPKPEFLLPLYFSDAKGNKDTVFTGYDPKGSPFLDGKGFGGKDIRTQPFDTTFDVRLGNHRQDLYVNQNLKDLGLPFMANTSVVGSSCKKKLSESAAVRAQFTIYFRCKYLPIKITWDSTLIDTCMINSFFHRHTLSGLSQTGSAERIYMRDKYGTLILSKDYLRDKSKNNYNGLATSDIILPTQDTLYSMQLFFLSIKRNYYSTIGVNDITESASMKVTPNPASQSIEIAYEGNKISKGIHITDISGKSMLRSNITNDFWQKEKQTIYISAYPQGIYFLQLDFDDGTSGVQRFVKME
jgi:hypothetical protein